MNHFSDKVRFIWSVADLLRGPYRPAQYGRVILPLTVLRRLDCVLEPTKDKVLAKYASLEGSKVANIIYNIQETPTCREPGGCLVSPSPVGVSCIGRVHRSDAVRPIPRQNRRAVVTGIPEPIRSMAGRVTIRTQSSLLPMWRGR